MTNDAWKPLPPETFDIPVHEIRRGYRSDVYFWRSKVALENARQETSVLMQVFQKETAVLCGVDESLAILKLGSGYYTDREKAYQLFDHYINLKKKIRSLYYNSKEKMLEAQRERLEIAQVLDDLWESTPVRQPFENPQRRGYDPMAGQPLDSSAIKPLPHAS